MYDVSSGAKGGFPRIGILTRPDRRRRWSAKDKARIVEETLAPGARATEVARRWQLRPQQVFAWRREAREAIAATSAASGIRRVRADRCARRSCGDRTARDAGGACHRDRARRRRGARGRGECPETGGITPPLPVAGLGSRPAQTAGRTPNRARRCRPHSEPGAEDRRLVATIASAAICSFGD